MTTDKIQDYELLLLIGEGCYNCATIHLAKHRQSGQLSAVKQYNLERMDEVEIDWSIIQREVAVCSTLRHDNLLTAARVFTAAATVCEVLPLAGYGSCKELLLSAHFKYGLPEEAIQCILNGVITALEYLHSKGIIHRAVRAAHILICSDGRVRLSGLRHAISLLDGGRRRECVHDYPQHYLQSLLWAAPELLHQNLAGYGTSSDVYSVGITACELANGAVPYADKPTTEMLLDKLQGSAPPQLWDSQTLMDAAAEHDTDQDAIRPFISRAFSLMFHNFTDVCLHLQPAERPRCSELLQHSFVERGRRRRSGAACLPELLLPVQPLERIVENLKQPGTDADGAALVSAMQDVTLTDDNWLF